MLKKKKLSILILSLGAGGAEKVVSLLIPKLIDDYDVTLVLFNDVIHFKTSDDLKIVILNSKTSQNKFFKIFTFLIIYFKYLNFLRRESVEISLSLLTRPNLINTLCRIFNNKTKIIISERCYPSIAYKSDQLRFRLYKFLLPKLYNRADVLFSNSYHINQDLKNNFGLKIPMSVIYNPVQIPTFSFRPNSAEKNIDILWIGKLNKIKNPFLLIRSLKQITNSLNTCVLGEGTLLSELKFNSEELNVNYVGKVNNVDEYLERSRILVLTSESEGFPNVILEGMAYGLPIIATNCKSGPLELLNENLEVNIPEKEFVIVKYGILINTNDDIALAKAISAILNSSELYTKLTLASFTRSNHYSVDNIYKDIKNLIDTV